MIGYRLNLQIVRMQWINPAVILQLGERHIERHIDNVCKRCRRTWMCVQSRRSQSGTGCLVSWNNDMLAFLKLTKQFYGLNLRFSFKYLKLQCLFSSKSQSFVTTWHTNCVLFQSHSSNTIQVIFSVSIHLIFQGFSSRCLTVLQGRLSLSKDVRSNIQIIWKQRALREQAETVAALAKACTATSSRTTPIKVKSGEFSGSPGEIWLFVYSVVKYTVTGCDSLFRSQSAV